MRQLDINQARQELAKLTQLKQEDPSKDVQDQSAHAVVGLLARVVDAIYRDLDARLPKLDEDAARR